MPCASEPVTVIALNNSARHEADPAAVFKGSYSRFGKASRALVACQFYAGDCGALVKEAPPSLPVWASNRVPNVVMKAERWTADMLLERSGPSFQGRIFPGALLICTRHPPGRDVAQIVPRKTEAVMSRREEIAVGGLTS